MSIKYPCDNCSMQAYQDCLLGCSEYWAWRNYQDWARKNQDSNIKRSVIDTSKLTQKKEQSGWVPVADRLPEKDKNVFVYLFGKSPYIAWWDGFEWRTEDFSLTSDEAPTAWMPLPEPPEPWKGESEEK